MTHTPPAVPAAKIRRRAINTNLVFVGYVLFAGLLLAGCRSVQSTPDQIVLATEHIEDPIRQLQAQAELQALTPLAPAADSVLAEIIPDAPAMLAAGSPEHQRGLLTLDQVIATIPTPSLPAPPDEPSADDLARATKLYTNARSLIQDGQREEGVEKLHQAITLDPTSPDLLNYLGDTYLDLGDRMSAIGAFRQAADLGGASARALTMLASDAANEGNLDEVLWLTTQARLIADDDPMAKTISSVLLGALLIEDGRLNAGATAMTEALESFDETSRDPRWRSEIVQFYTQRRTLWMHVGDAWTAINAQSRAARAYANAIDPEQPMPIPMIARKIGSELRTGRPASAALSFLSHITLAPARTADTERGWARTLRSIDSLSTLLPDAIRASRMSTQLRPSEAHALTRIELAARPTTQGRIDALCSPSYTWPSTIVVAEAIAMLDTDADRFDACVQITRAHPESAREISIACVRSLIDPFPFLRSRMHAADQDQRLLLDHIALTLARPDAMRGAPEVDSMQSAALLGIETRIAFLNGDWKHAEDLLATLQSMDTPFATRQRAWALISAQRPSEAWALISANADFSDASIDDLADAASIALLLDKPGDARSYFERTLEADPDRVEAYEQLILLHAPGADLEDAEEYKRLLRLLTSRLPRSPLVTLTRANELARNRLLRESETLLTELSHKTPHQQIGVPLLIGIWAALDSAGDDEALGRAERWLVDRLESMPSSVPIRMRLAQIKLQQELPEQALRILDEGYAKTGSFELARAAEQVLTSSLDRPGEAIERAIERTELAHGFDASIERAQQLARDQRETEAIQLLIDTLPASIELLPAQRQRMTAILFQLANKNDELLVSDQWLSLFDATSSWISPIPDQLLRIQISMLAQLHPSEHQSLATATAAALTHLPDDASEEQHNAVEIIAVQQLLADERINDAFAVLHALAVRTGSLDDRLGFELLRFGAGLGDTGSVRKMLDRLTADGFLDEMIELSTDQLAIPLRPRPAESDAEKQADISYTLASLAGAFNRPDATTELLELALAYDADQPWANNDYGYMLAESNERLEEGERMLERALNALPENPSVLDSLGWARYKLNVLNDETDGEAKIVREGAITLLRRAIAIELEQEENGNATIHDHLGDAYWWVGRYDDAIVGWLEAERLLRRQLQQISVEDTINDQAVVSLSTRLRDIRLKISDAEAGAAPKLAEIPTSTDQVPVDPRVKMDPMK